MAVNWSAVIFILFLLSVNAQDENCDFYQNVEPGQTYYITSPNYPNNYPPGITCRWQASAPENYRIRIACDIDIPASSDCSEDRLLISRTGDPSLRNADKYCGRGRTTVTSISNRISIGLVVSRSSSGGRFLCELNAEPNNL